MAVKKDEFTRGITLRPDDVGVDGIEGELKVGATSKKLHAYLNGALRSMVDENSSATLTNKTLTSPVINTGVSGTAIDTDGTLAANSDTLLASQKAVKTYADAIASTGSAALQAHINDTTDAHDASAISNVPAGTVGSTDVQAAINELDGDIQGHITNATAAHAASAVSVSPTGNLSSTDVQAALVEHQGDINTINSSLGTFIVGPLSSTDNHLVRFDGTSGKLAQDGSTAVLSDAGALSGLTQLDVDNIRVDGNTISTTDTNGNLTLAPNGTGTVVTSNTVDINGLVQFASANDAATGSNVTLTTPTTKVIRLTNASLVSIDGIPAGVDARELIIENATGTTVAINEDTGATTANRFYTGTTAGINLADKASLALSYDSTSSRWRVIGGSGSGSGQVLDTFVQLDASELLSTWSTGNNATFLGGGALAGTFAKDTSTPLNGTASYKYTQATSINDYIASPVQSVPLRFRGNAATCTFSYTYNGGNSDIEPIVYDVTNAAKLTTSTNLLPAFGSPAQLYKVNVAIPSTCTQLRVGFQTKITNSGKILAFDDIQVSADTTKYADAGLGTDWTSYTPTLGAGFGTTTNLSAKWRRVGDSYQVSGYFVLGTAAAALGSISLPNSASVDVNKLTQNNTTANNGTKIGTYQTNGASTLGNIVTAPATNATLVYMSHAYNNAAMLTPTNTSSVIGTGSVFEFDFTVPIAGLSASNPQIITAAESFSSDTASLVYASSSSYTISTLTDAPIGTFITYTVASGSNTRTQTTTAPTQTTSDMNTNGLQIFTRAFNATSTAASPAVFAIQIGKKLKGETIDLYKSAGKVLSGSTKLSLRGGDTTQRGLQFESYDETTGILTLDAANCTSGSVTASEFVFTDATTQTSGYLVINASKSPALVGVPQVVERIATISDVKAANTAGGTATADGTFKTRDLNTLVDSTGIGITLSSNQFTLPAGTYYIEALAPAYDAVVHHKAKLRNITDSSDAIIGTSSFNTTSAFSYSAVRGEVIITATKTFEIQHRFESTIATQGLGTASNFGVSEVYTTVKITKVK